MTPGLGWNLFDGGRVSGAVDEEVALTQAAAQAYQNTVLLAVEETENAIASLRLRREQMVALERVVAASKRSASLAREVYKQGLRWDNEMQLRQVYVKRRSTEIRCGSYHGPSKP